MGTQMCWNKRDLWAASMILNEHVILDLELGLGGEPSANGEDVIGWLM